MFLHPVFTLLFIFMIAYSYYEVNENNEKKPIGVWIAGVAMIIFCGLRFYVGADYPVYRTMYYVYFPTVETQPILDKMLFKQANLEIEWLYVVLNKFLFMFNAPFQYFTLVSAMITIGIKMFTYYKDSKYPVFSLLLFFIPAYFIADSGHMRQALGMAVCLFSYKFVKERKLFWYLLCLYVAVGFHKSSSIFLPVYWLVLIPMNSRKILWAIVICVILSPFKIYNSFSGFLQSLTPQDISNGFEGYIDYEDKASSFSDAVMIMNAIMLIVFDKAASKKIYYYEYMRNIMVFGVCLYFIMRDNPVFATRLVGPYIGFSALVIPNIIASIEENARKKMLHSFFIVFTVFYYFVFVSFQGRKGKFTPDTYRNYIWVSE